MTDPPLRDFGDTEKKPWRIDVAVGVVVVAVELLPAATAATAALRRSPTKSRLGAISLIAETTTTEDDEVE